MDLRPGSKVYDASGKADCTIISPCGAGSFGAVYEVKDSSGNTLALKTLPTVLLNDLSVKTLQNEGRLATQIRHPNALQVVYFHDGDEHPALPPYMLMEFADGGTLQEVLTERRSANQMFSNEELRAIFTSLCSGMKAINEKLVHRDIKPDNILLVGGVIKISDFGLAKIVGEATRSSTFKGINHIRYCAPEAWLGAGNTPSMDMYSMGIVFYELVTLKHPYVVSGAGVPVDEWKTAHSTHRAENPQTVNRSLDSVLAQVTLKMIAKRPSDRYASWDEVLQALQRPQAPSDARPAVEALVAKTIATYQKREHLRLATEQKQQEEQALQDRIKYAFGDIHQAGEQIVQAYNDSSELGKLRILDRSGLSFSITSTANTGKMVTVAVVPLVPMERPQMLDRKPILAWGHARSDSGRGFNLLLVAESATDFFGRWCTFHVSHSPFARDGGKRPEPFAFEIGELPREITLVRAMHIYVTKQDVFNREMLTPLIAELV